MTLRRRLFRAAALPALIGIFLAWSGAAAQQSRIELVESVPEETVLGLASTGRTAAVWKSLIDGARSTLDIEQFYIATAPGEALGPVLASVEAAAARGVRVRVIAEKKFAEKYPSTLEAWSHTANMDVRILDFARVSGRGVQHAKFFVVDGERAFLGSQNFDWRSLSQIHETGVSISSAPLARALGSVFEMDWILAAAHDTAAARRDAPPCNCAPQRVRVAGGGSVTVRPVFSPRTFIPRGAEWDLPALVRIIDGARRAVCVQVLSYGTKDDTTLDAALRRAAARGVNVRLLVSNWSLGTARQNALKALVGKGVRVRFTSIPQHSRGFISFARVEHCKYMVVDGRTAWIGTSNWSPDYFHDSRNVGLIAEGTTLASQLTRIFDASWSGPYAVDLDPAKSYTPPRTDDGSGK